MKTMAAAASLVCALAFAAPAAAALSQAQLDTANAAPRPGATLNLATKLQDLNGDSFELAQALDAPTTVVVFVDFRCPDLCSPIVALVARALRDSGLKPGSDYRLALIGFNPSADADDARRMVEGQIENASVREPTRVFLGPRQAVARLAAQAGYGFVYDPERGRYAHPVTLYVADRNGRIARTLPALAVTAANLRLALVDAGAGVVGDFGDFIQLHCYGFNADVGFYADRVRVALLTACGLTVLAGAAALARLAIRRPS